MERAITDHFDLYYCFFVLVYLTLYSLAVIICTTMFNTFFPYSAFTYFERILVLTQLLLCATLTDWL
jgi:hypothetical protein